MVDSSLFSLQALKAKPAMNPKAVLGGKPGDHWRIGILTDALVRFEWSDSGQFVDDPTQMAIVRDFGEVPQFTAVERDGWLEIDTAALHISYNMRPFSKEGLYATVKGVNSVYNTWHFGAGAHGNLGGTRKTLDLANGSIPLEPGVNSVNGWATIDDSKSNIIRKADDGEGKTNPFGTWIYPKANPSTDLYLFGYGHRYRQAVHDFYTLTGPTPLLPRFTLGNWWSRYHRYTEPEYKALVERFESEGIPFTTAVIDMDWHLVDDVDSKYGSGWTGYTWNRNFFPDPKEFLSWLHSHGLKDTLNVHPRDGVRAFEDKYDDMAKAVGIDPESGEAVQFDLTNPEFMAAYFDKLHHPMEDEGVDFWWLDWQQGGTTRQPGLNPLWGLNHLHYLDSARQDGTRGAQRPLTFSRYAGPGSHRYPIGFSGDTVVTWESLAFQPYFTATASNIGYGWWSHDIGGHMYGYRDEELEARWYQLGTFSPINRLHSTKSPFQSKEPWNFRTEVRDSMVASLRLRHALIPYLYTMNRRAAYENEPLVQPLYWDFPENDEAYKAKTEFKFGTQLLVSPIVAPADRDSQRAKADVWLPQGTWFDFFTGRRYESATPSGRRIEAWRKINGMPVFAKAGGIVPLQHVPENADAATAEHETLNSIANPDKLDVVIFPEADGSFTLWEDDGASEATNRWASTSMTLSGASDGTRPTTFTISAAEGETDVLPARRSWNLVFRGVTPKAADGIEVAVGGETLNASTVNVTYDERTLSLCIAIDAIDTGRDVTVAFADGLETANDPADHDAFDVLMDAQVFYRTKERAWAMLQEQGAKALTALSTLEVPADPKDDSYPQSHMPQSVIQALNEVYNRC